MEKLLIIGAGIGQMPLLQRAKMKGIHVTVATRDGDYPCIAEADDVIYIDIYERSELANEARRRGITAVISDQNDLTNPTVAYVAEKLGLPGNAFETVMSYCNKNRFRDMCDKVGVPCPKHIEIMAPANDAGCLTGHFPLMVKPADSQSSIAVQKVESESDLANAIRFAQEKSPTNSAIVEDYICAKEIVCEGFIINGEYHLLEFADRKYFELEDKFIPNQTLFPSVVSKDILNKVVKYETELAEYSKPSFAIVHSEYLVNELTGEIWIVESALRGGGVYISSDLIPLATGIDINELLLQLSLGKSVDVAGCFGNRCHKASGYVCFYLPEGIICGIEGIEKLNELSFVHAAYIDDLKVGEATQPMTFKGARKGPILVTGDTRRELENHIQEVQSVLRYSVECPDGKVRGAIWR
ncbi:MAG: ATP-grasp domain-containing protein [Atopobiaceae bacterium]|nr:ATP-grasp domain-containing protein [Atopobiaceae bacterium]